MTYILTDKEKDYIREGVLNESLYLQTNNEEQLNSYYSYIVNNTKKDHIPLKSLFLETSNVLIDTSDEEQSSMLEYLSEDEVEQLESEREFDINHEKENTTFLNDKFITAPSVTDEMVNLFNSTTNVWAVMPTDFDRVYEEVKKHNFLSLEEGRKIINDVGFNLVPMTYNAIKDVVKKKIGDSKAVMSSVNIGNGKLKREVSIQSVLYSGRNIDNNKAGFFKNIFGAHFAYLSNFTDLNAAKASNELAAVYNHEGYSDVAFKEGVLTPYLYSATYTSVSLGEEIAKKAGIPFSSAWVDMEFKTSDLGLSSVNVTPVLYLEVLSSLGFAKVISIALSEMVTLNHNAEVVNLSVWHDKCEEAFSYAQDTAMYLNNASSIILTNPEKTINNILEDLSVPQTLDGKDDIISELILSAGLDGVDVSARDAYLTISEILGKWQTSNLNGALRGKEKLSRILKNKHWTKY